MVALAEVKTEAVVAGDARSFLERERERRGRKEPLAVGHGGSLEPDRTQNVLGISAGRLDGFGEAHRGRARDHRTASDARGP